MTRIEALCPTLVQQAWRIWTGLAAVIGLAATALVFTAQSAGASVAMGFSAARLGMAGLLLLAGLLPAWWFVESWLRPQASRRRQKWIIGLADRRIRTTVLLICGVVLFVALNLIAAWIEPLDEQMGLLLKRLVPVLVWVAGLALLTVAVVLFFQHNSGETVRLPRSRLFYLALASFAIIFLAWSWGRVNVLPSESHRLGWNRPGTPVTGLQLMAAWGAGIGLIAWTGRWLRSKGALPRRLDLVIGLLIWLAAVIAWQATPLTPNWFVSAPVHPNFEYYPSSDARAYDSTAQTTLIGVGYRFYDAVYVRRSLLAAFLTVLHLIGGQNYERVVFLQILALALFPVLVYLVAARLWNRAAGVTAAGLIVLREANSIALGQAITTSNVKLLMADLPTALMTVLFVLFVVRWLQDLDQRPWLALVAGGVLGFSMLIRLETFVYFFPVAIAAALILWPRRQFRLWLGNGLLAVLGIALAVGPWMVRNYCLTGEVFIDHPYFSVALLIQRFAPTIAPTPQPGGDGSILPAATQGAVPLSGDQEQPESNPAGPQLSTPEPPGNTDALPTQMPSPPDGAPEPPAFFEQASENALVNITSNLGRMFGVVSTHMLNSSIQTFLILPEAYRVDGLLGLAARRAPTEIWNACCSIEAYVDRLPYWGPWDGRFSSLSLLPLALNLLLIAAGLSYAWKLRRWIGLTPLLMGITYIIFNGALRNSGGRYVLPVDWISLMYFSIGLVAITGRVLSALTGRQCSLLDMDSTVPSHPTGADGVSLLQMRADAPGAKEEAGAIPVSGRRIKIDRYILPALVLLALGAVIPLVEISFPVRYTPERQAAMLTALLSSDQLSADQRQGLETFLSNGAVTIAGRGLYPRFFPPNVGDPVDPPNPLAPQPYPRLGFYLLGEISMNMSLPVDRKPQSFPNAGDVLVVACPERDLLAVARFNTSGMIKSIYLRSPFPAAWTCPLLQETQKSPGP